MRREIRYLRRGKMIDPANEAIERGLRELGLRNPPVLGFLPRRHVLNSDGVSFSQAG